MESLAEYPYVVSNMDDNGFIPIRLLLPFFYPSVPTVTIADVVEAVKDSEKVIVDANLELIRPNITVERKTIILRDIPESTTEEEVRSLFAGLGSIESIKPSIGNNWYIFYSIVISKVCSNGFRESCSGSSESDSKQTIQRNHYPCTNQE